MSWRNSVCMSIGAVSCPNANSLVQEITKERLSPIDDFYLATNPTLTRVNPEFVEKYGQEVVGLLFVGLISATENYFRDIFGAILTTCPISQAYAADEKVQLGSLLWSQGGLQNRSAFEFLAFSSARSIKDTVKNFVDHQIRPKGNFDLMLAEYDKLCELRHAVVHSAHIVAGKNALKLGLQKTKGVLKVTLEYPELQAAGSVCTALVQSANNELYEALVKRWAQDWRQLPSWEPAKEELEFKKIVSAFLSKRDQSNGTITNSLRLKTLISQIKADFNL